MTESLKPRKRDRLRQIFHRDQGRASPGRPLPPTQTQPAVAAVATPATSSASLPRRDSPDRRDSGVPDKPSQVFLDEALRELNTEQQATIRKYLAPDTTEIGPAVSQVYDAAQKQKKTCQDNQWRWKIKGHTIVLRDLAEKVVQWLDRLKPIGDAVAGLDTIHIGLPWAGIRILLGVVTSDVGEMAALLIGMDRALRIANKLEAYCVYFQHLPQVLPKSDFASLVRASANATLTNSSHASAAVNFAKSLVDLYAHILKFLATAIETYERSPLSRMWLAVWKSSNLDAFESGSVKLEIDARDTAAICERELSEQDRQNTKRWRNELDQKLESFGNIQKLTDSLEDLHTKFDLSRLVIAKGATHNAHENESVARCLEGTRKDLLQEVFDWANDCSKDSKRIFWLCGKAGTGKSTISYTIADRLDASCRLGASFFFKRGEGDRGNASCFFPTLAQQLADVVPGLSSSIAKALALQPLLCDQNLQKQFDNLLLQPLVTASTVPPNLIVVIDALDECERVHDIKLLLRLLSQLEVRVFVTSRPDGDIQRGFRRIDGHLHNDVHLEEMQAPTIEHDIRLYLRHRFKEIRDDDLMKHPRDPLSAEWPGDGKIDALVNLAVPLFIFATTACRYIESQNTANRLDLILNQQRCHTLSGLSTIYLTILEQMITNLNDEEDGMTELDAITEFRNLVGPIILLADPLSVLSISDLFVVSPRQIEDMLNHLHSVLYVHIDESPVRPLHLSFRDFLVSKGGKGINKFYIDEIQTHRLLSDHCIRRLSRDGTLHDDIFGVGRLTTRRKFVSGDRVQFPAGVAYACRYWIWHIVQTGELLYDGCQVHEFLQRHFLHWLEALSWLGHLLTAVEQIGQLKIQTDLTRGPQLRRFLGDASRFLLRIRYIANLAPLQLYSSALYFTPTSSPIKQLFVDSDRTSELFSRLPEARSNWSPMTHSLEGHDGRVTGLAFSADGTVIISGSYDHTIRFWNMQTGEEIQELTGHSGDINGIAMSNDGKMLASASDDKTIQLWDGLTGEHIRTLVGHTQPVDGVAISPNGALVASTSLDGTVRIWDAQTGEVNLSLDREDPKIIAFGNPHRLVNCVAFSPDGLSIASAFGHAIHLCNVHTGEQFQTLEGHANQVIRVNFSPDGNLLVSCSIDETVRLWSLQTGKEVHQLKAYVFAAQFSPDGKTVATACLDNDTRIWDVLTGKEIRVLRGHISTVHALAFSPDGSFLASGSDDDSIVLWDNLLESEMQPAKGHTNGVNSVVFSPNGEILASASDEVCLWSMQTCEVLRILDGHKVGVHVLAFSPNGSALVSASQVGEIRLWDVSTGRLIREIDVPTEAFVAIQFSPDGQLLASGSSLGSVRLWDLRTGEPVHTLHGHGGFIEECAFSPDGCVLASGSWDHTVRLWNVENGEESLRLEHPAKIQGVAWSPDGNKLATASRLGHVDGDDKPPELHLWNTRTGEQIAVIETTIWELPRILEFSYVGRRLYTVMESYVTDQSEPPKEEPILSQRGRWITYKDQDHLWLPIEYDGNSHAQYGDMFVAGQTSGDVSFFRL